MNKKQTLLAEMREVAGKDGGILGQFAEKWANELERMTPNTPAGGAVAPRAFVCDLDSGPGMLMHAGPDADKLREVFEPRGIVFQALYTQPPATVSLDAVRVLLAEYDALAQHFDHDRAGRKLRDELEALTHEATK